MEKITAMMMAVMMMRIVMMTETLMAMMTVVMMMTHTIINYDVDDGGNDRCDVETLILVIAMLSVSDMVAL